MRHRFIALLLAVSLLGAGLPTSTMAASVSITEFSVPSAAAEGETVTVVAVGEGDLPIDNEEITLKVIREDTGRVICRRDFTLPGAAECRPTFSMPSHDVPIRVTFGFELGETMDTAGATISLESTAAPTATPTPSGDDTTEQDGADEQDFIESIIGGFTDSGESTLGQIVTDSLTTAVFTPFQYLAHQLLKAVAVLLVWTPDVHPNPAVEDVHQDTFIVAVLLTGLAVAVTGLLYMVGPIVNVSYRDARLILPRLIVALVFAAISLPILQLFVDLSNAFVTAFKPTMFETSIGEMAGVSVAAVLVWVINAFLLVVVAAVYILRDVYILFVAAISPLIAMAWAFPKTRRHAQTFIAGWWTALAMGPLAMLVLKFVFTLMDGAGTGPLQSVGNWLFGVAGFALLLFVPWQLYGASQAIVGQAYSMVGGFERGARRKLDQYREHRRNQDRMEAFRRTYRPEPRDGGPGPNTYGEMMEDWNRERRD